MSRIEIREIKECTAYTAEYEIRDIEDFFDGETGMNILLALQEKMEEENPDVHVPDIPDDYNFFEYPMGDMGNGVLKGRYYDLVDKAGKDCEDYRFVTVPGCTVACYFHRGSFKKMGESLQIVRDWLDENGYEQISLARCSAIHGPWDTENVDEYMQELQVPVRKVK